MSRGLALVEMLIAVCGAVAASMSGKTTISGAIDRLLPKRTSEPPLASRAPGTVSTSQDGWAGIGVAVSGMLMLRTSAGFRGSTKLVLEMGRASNWRGPFTLLSAASRIRICVELPRVYT